jgi:transposase-like protein
VKELPVPCPHCAAFESAEQPRRTALGYRIFRCGRCRRAFNERTGTPFNHLQYPTDLVLLVVLWRLRYKLSLRDLAEMFLARGLVFSHEAVRDWEARFAPLLTAQLRAKRRGRAGTRWHADETYLRVNGRWCYLCAIKQRYYPMRGFGSFASATRFCSAFEEQRQYFRAVTWSSEPVSLAKRRQRFLDRWASVMAELATA